MSIAHGVDDALDARNILLFESRQRHDDVIAGDALDGRQQRIKRALGDLCGDLGAKARGARRLVHDDASSGLLDRSQNRFHIERLHRRDVDHLDIDRPALRALRRRRSVFGNHGAPGDDRRVAAFAADETCVERQRLAVVVDLLLEQAIEPRRLEKDHRIGIAHRREQQTIGARGRGRDHDTQTRHMREQRLGALGMMLGRVNAGAIRRAQHHRAGEPPARAITQSRGVIDDLIDRGIDEAGELDLGDRLQAHGRHADRDAGDPALGERRVDDARRAEARLQGRSSRETRRH